MVVIGRNEGERLERCLNSVVSLASQVVYVDSGSTDGSVEFAKSIGVDVVELNMDRPFTMARGRNTGFKRLLELNQSLDYVQFVDGDCEVVHGWLEKARAQLVAEPGLAVVFGRRRERFPEASIYNRMIDREWDVPIGEVQSCGGDAMMRISAFKQVEGFDDGLIAGEEPELSVRLRKLGWGIRRIDAEMTIHDAAMYYFRQWWLRAIRCGWSYAEGVVMHGAPPERHRVAHSRRAWLWGAIIPGTSFILSWPTRGLSLLLLGLYPVQWSKIALSLMARERLPIREATIEATFTVIGKFPEAIGQTKFWYTRILGHQRRLIEYK